MNTPKDDHSVTSSPLMCLEFIIIQTIIWGFLLPVLAYALELFLIMPLSNYLRSLSLFIPGLYYVLKLFAWPGVMVTALIITVIRCFLRYTTVTLSGSTIIIQRLRHTERLAVSDFIRPKTVESFVNVRFAAWVFRKRYLIFRGDAGKEVKYRLYEYSEKDLEHVMQFLTRINRTESLDENCRTEIIMDAFQNKTEILLDPRRLWGRMAGRLTMFCLFSPVGFVVFTCLYYELLFSPSRYGSGSAFSHAIGYAAILFSFGSLFLLCRSLWALAVGAVQKSSCPQKIVFAGDMMQIDQTLYSVNRIQQIVMNPPDKKPPLLGHYQITVITADGTHKYWLGNHAGLPYGTWQTLCRNMQNLLISCPARLVYR